MDQARTQQEAKETVKSSLSYVHGKQKEEDLVQSSQHQPTNKRSQPKQILKNH